MEIFTVTFCTMDREVNANPFGHAFLLLSCFDEATKKMKVIENWGFGGVPASSSYQLIRKIKVNLGMDTDFYGNHGMIYAEEMRRLERGYGLHGATFELTEEKFKLLQQKCHKMANDQNDAINEAIRALNLKPSIAKKIRNYEYEHESHRIYHHELNQAELEQREPRLHEFSISFHGKLHNCKAQVLNLLYGIITADQFIRVTGWHSAVPRLSGPMEDIYLHSTGPLHQHTKKSEKKVNYRKANEAELFWTLPPQEIETLSKSAFDFLKIHDDHCAEIKSVIRQLQSLEWFFRDAELPQEQSERREKLIHYIINLYEAFAVINPKKSQVAKNDGHSFWQWLASQPRDVDEKILLDKLANAKHFILSLYHAIADGWEMDTNEDHEILATLLSIDEQKKLCSIIGRSYINPEEDTANSVDNRLALRVR